LVNNHCFVIGSILFFELTRHKRLFFKWIFTPV